MISPARLRLTAALVADLIGAGGALLIAGRAWQTVLAPRPRPLADDIVQVTGRTLEPAVTALALVALAGIVAVLATKGIARRVVGALLVLAGAGLVWSASGGFSAVSPARARSLVSSARTGVGLEISRAPQVSVHGEWPALVIVCGLLVLAAGAVVAARGHTWSGLSGRYEAPTAGARAERATRGSADAAMWNALDRGADPTNDDR